MNLWLIFLTGLTSGGLSCLAVQGGLLASVIANQKEEELKVDSKANAAKSFDQLDWLPVSLFLVAKLFAHILLGFFLGWLGSKLELSLTMRLIFQTVAALFMIGTAMNLLEVHPIFRYLVIQPPKFFQRLVRGTSKGKAFFTPVVLGLLTIFVPCGITQSMEVTAISLGSPLQGALIMGAFVFGTLPIFAVVGIATAKLSETFQKNFMKVAAAALIFLGLLSLNGVLVVMNSPLSWQNISNSVVNIIFGSQSNAQLFGATQAPIVNGVQQVEITVNDKGYSPTKIVVKAGMPVQLTVSTKETYSCASTFLLKAFHISFQLAPTDSKSVTFTPTQAGSYQFNCSMGMYKGVLEVI